MEYEVKEMSQDYIPLATVTLASSTSQVTFSNIPNNYKDLILVTDGIGSSPQNLLLRFNSDSGSNYSYTQVYGDGSAAGSTRGTNETFARVGPMYNSQSITTASVMNYSNSTTNKTVVARANNAGNQVNALVSLWRNTAAITNVTVNAIFGQFNSGTTVSLYGIKAGS
jgi:hypothetical protein